MVVAEDSRDRVMLFKSLEGVEAEFSSVRSLPEALRDKSVMCV